jgi:hypothetical protein
MLVMSKVVSVIVHHVFAKLHGMLGALFWHGMPLSVAYSIDAVSILCFVSV